MHTRFATGHGMKAIGCATTKSIVPVATSALHCIWVSALTPTSPAARDMNQEPEPAARSMPPTTRADTPATLGNDCPVVPASSVYWHTVQLWPVAASTVVGFDGKQKLPPM